MKRKEVENYMKSHNLTQIDLIFNKDDKRAVYCMLRVGYLKDYNAKPVDRKVDIWGYLVWKNGKSTRVAWEEE